LDVGGKSMIAPQAEIDLVNGKKRDLMLLPVEYGPGGERRPCPIEQHALVSLQPALFVKGTKITITKIERREIDELTDTDARHLGFPDIQRALEVFRRQYDACGKEVWAAAFVLGNRTAFIRMHRERYLKAKGAGLTFDPHQGVRGEPAVTEEEQLDIARKARNERILTERERAKEQRAIIKTALGELRGLQLDRDVEKEIDRAERRLQQLDKVLETNVQKRAA
jgi:hypothetical protein